ncbi:MAG: heavy metal translocating P-type ATPase [Marinifilaceae bacterium]
MDNKACVHCGEDCGRHPILWNDMPFCCSGCKTVYQLINEHKLYSYYEIESNPGIRIESEKLRDKFAYLDQEELVEQLYEFSEGKQRKVTLYVPAIHCSSCIWLLENLHVMHPGVHKSLVNFLKKEVTVHFDIEQITLRQLVELMASIHYVPEITLDRIQKKKNQKNRKKILYKIGVAGFCFGNIMLLSLPEYIPGKEQLEENFKGFFGMMNFLLALPVFLYSGNDYLISAYKGLKHKFINIDLPISIGILALFIQSSFEIFTSAGPGYMDSLTGLIFFLLIGKWYQNHTYQALSFERDYRSYFPVAVSKLVDGKEVSTPIEELQPGDRILVRNQELVPADSVLEKGEGQIDYSFVSGESTPVFKAEGSQIFAGGKQMGSAIELRIEKEVVQSRLTQLWNQFEEEQTAPSKLKSIIDNVSQYFTLIILLIGISAGLYWVLNDSSKALYALTSVLIVACPCALALSAPFALGNTMRLMGRLGIYLKNSHVIEKLNSITTIVFDKTGTITQSDAVKIEFLGEALGEGDLIAVKSVTRHSTHVLSAAIYEHLNNHDVVQVENYEEIPAKGITANVNGKTIRLGSQSFILGVKAHETVLTTKVYLETDGVTKGYFALSNQYREGLDALIKDLSSHFNLHLISGDNEAERTNLVQYFGSNNNLHFNQSPQDKLEYIRKLQAKGEKVLMIGDGLNDAGALKTSNAGISIADDIYHFSPACDAILEAKQFSRLGRFLKITKQSINIVKMSIGLSFLYNIVGLYFAVQGVLSPIIAALLMPISSVSVVAFVTFTTNYIARNKKQDLHLAKESSPQLKNEKLDPDVIEINQPIP